LLARPAAALAGLLEVRGVGLMRVAHEPCAVVGWVVDLAAAEAKRLGAAALPPVLALINSPPDS
jgi:hypothetical protein